MKAVCETRNANACCGLSYTFNLIFVTLRLPVARDVAQPDDGNIDGVSGGVFAALQCCHPARVLDDSAAREAERACGRVVVNGIARMDRAGTGWSDPDIAFN